MKKILLGIIILTVFGVGGWYVFSDQQEPIPTVIDVPSTPSAPVPINTVTYVCDGQKTITAAFYRGESEEGAIPEQAPTPTGSVDLVLSDGRTMKLSQAISADGARYASDDAMFVFWSKGNGALVLENNQEKDFVGCIAASPEPAAGNLSKIYANSLQGFSVRLPDFATSSVFAEAALSTSSPDLSNTYLLTESYRYTGLGSKKEIVGTKFTIPSAVATGTNLASDTYVSVESIPLKQKCTADLFLSDGVAVDLVDGDMTYSFASSTDAAAGNRYEEYVYALPGTNPCVAVRYFVHYGAFENYDAEVVHEFDKKTLLDSFDQIRRTLMVN